MSHSRSGSSAGPNLDIPRKSTELRDPGAHSLSSDDEYFSDASEGRKKASRPDTPASPIPKTRVERVDDSPAYGEVPGTTAYDKRTTDAVPDELEVVPEGRLSKRSSQYLEPTTPGGTAIPRTVVEKLDPEETGYGDDPKSPAFQHRRLDSVPDVVLKAPGPGRRRNLEEEESPVQSPDRPIPETIITKVDSRPAHGEVPGTAAFDKRRADASADVVEQVDDSPGSSRPIKHTRRRSTMKSLDINEIDDDNTFGDDFDDFEEGAQAGAADDDFGDFDEGLDEPHEIIQEPEQYPVQNTHPLIDFDVLSSLPDLLKATQHHFDDMFPTTTEEALANLSKPEPIDAASPIFPSERSRSLWKQLVTPPPLQPPNWTQSKIRRNFLVSLGVPVDLDEILPPSKQKKLVLPDINLETSYRTSTDKAVGSVARLKQQAANDSSASLDSNQSGKEGKSRGRRQKGPPPPPDLDLTAVRRLCATTDEKLAGLDDEELQEHVKQLENVSERTSEVLEYWLKRRDGLRKEKEAFEGVIENLVAHVRRVRR